MLFSADAHAFRSAFTNHPALRIAADTCPEPNACAQYERKAWPAGNAIVDFFLYKTICQSEPVEDLNAL
ncbi:hypothetical protein ABIB62_002542 [Mucilaginibacter sp. UYP25]|uniref:hypothetical protein n=1 Tax=unclassified Mucilaginibacter TaxID=2617802 RepID=UPI0033924B2B